MKIFKPSDITSVTKQAELDFLKENSFASIFSAYENKIELISKAPLVLKKEDESLFLEGHLAKANPHVQHLLNHSHISLVFDGPHGYISPTWYTSPSNNVPTWNYASVFVEGKASLTDSKEWLKNSVLELSDVYERDDKWKSSVDQNYFNSLLGGIVGIRIKIEDIHSKFKLSQNKSDKELNSLTSKLDNKALADLMNQKFGLRQKP